jgi:peptidoglycan/LPS O-acetylase OafA/YrhL
VLIATTAAYAAIVRAWLLVEETGGAHYQGIRIAGNYLQLGPNLYAIAENLLTPRLYIDAWIALLLLYGAALAAWGVREASPRRLAQGLFALGLLAAVLCFGIVNEARVFLISVPFLVFSLAEYGTAMARSLRDGRAE